MHLGETAPQVHAALGAHGLCEGCTTTTWYFNYGKFTQPGLAVELRRGRVSAVYTIWSPTGWHTASGLALGADEAQVTKQAGPLVSMQCPDYTALVRNAGALQSAYYIVNGKLWGFGLMAARTSPCR